MKKIEVSDDVYEILKSLTTDFHQSPNDVLAGLLNIGATPDPGDEPLVEFILGAEFRTKFSDADKYLAILGWIAAHHSPEFNEFILSLSGNPSGRRYLGLSREEIVDQCRHNQARQIPETRYWAIMNIDTATKRRFLSRVLEFIGYRQDVVDFVCNAIGMRHPPGLSARLPLSVAVSTNSLETPAKRR
jgi:negative modulator of initiation of replication